MRLQSAARAKRHKKMPLRDVPTEGTYLRATYDKFLSNRGVPIEFNQGGENTSAIAQLRDFYGMQIVRVSHLKYKLAGEWLGNVYVDYTRCPAPSEQPASA